jgi:hypothetical protein
MTQEFVNITSSDKPYNFLKNLSNFIVSSELDNILLFYDWELDWLDIRLK